MTMGAPKPRPPPMHELTLVFKRAIKATLVLRSRTDRKAELTLTESKP